MDPSTHILLLNRNKQQHFKRVTHTFQFEDIFTCPFLTFKVFVKL